MLNLTYVTLINTIKFRTFVSDSHFSCSLCIQPSLILWFLLNTSFLYSFLLSFISLITDSHDFLNKGWTAIINFLEFLKNYLLKLIQKIYFIQEFQIRTRRVIFQRTNFVYLCPPLFTETMFIIKKINC